MFSRTILGGFRVAKCTLRSCATSVESNSLKGSKVVLTGERGVNKVILVGRVGRDSEVRGSEDNPVTVFPLATSYTLKTKEGEYVQKTEWHRISVFRPVLRDLVARDIKKGDKVYVTGQISYSQYMDKSNVAQRAANIVADDVISLAASSHVEGFDKEEALI